MKSQYKMYVYTWIMFICAFDHWGYDWYDRCDWAL